MHNNATSYPQDQSESESPWPQQTGGGACTVLFLPGQVSPGFKAPTSSALHVPPTRGGVLLCSASIVWCCTVLVGVANLVALKQTPR